MPLISSPINILGTHPHTHTYAHTHIMSPPCSQHLPVVVRNKYITFLFSDHTTHIKPPPAKKEEEEEAEEKERAGEGGSMQPRRDEDDGEDDE